MHPDQRSFLEKLKDQKDRDAYRELIRTIEEAERTALGISESAHYYLEKEPDRSYSNHLAERLARSTGIPKAEIEASLESLREPRKKALAAMKAGKQALDFSTSAEYGGNVLMTAAIISFLMIFATRWALIPAAVLGVMAFIAKRQGKAARNFESQQRRAMQAR